MNINTLVLMQFYRETRLRTKEETMCLRRMCSLKTKNAQTGFHNINLRWNKCYIYSSGTKVMNITVEIFMMPGIYKDYDIGS